MLSRLSARLSSCGGGAGSSSSAALQLWHGTPLRWAAAVRGLASTVRPPSVRDAQIRIFGWAQPEAGKRGETRHGHAPMKTLEKLKRRGLIAEKVLNYFPRPDPKGISRHPLVRAALNQEREEKLNLRKQLGKGPPKKGQGKRASKKK